MLDQNTDRMWYVIGAVLVGAAIILIANGTLPKMFASVTDSFHGVGFMATEEVKNIGMRKELIREYTLADMTPSSNTQTNDWISDNADIFSPDENLYGGFYFSPGTVIEGRSYVLEFDIQKINGDIMGLGGHLHIGSKSNVKISGNTMDLWDRNGQVDLDNYVGYKNVWNLASIYPNDLEKHSVQVYFTVSEDISDISDRRIHIQPNRAGRPEYYKMNELDYTVLLENVRLYQFVEEEVE